MAKRQRDKPGLMSQEKHTLTPFLTDVSSEGVRKTLIEATKFFDANITPTPAKRRKK